MATQLTRAMRACGAVALRQMRRRRRSGAFFATLLYPTDDGHPVIDMAPLLSDNDSGASGHHDGASPPSCAGDRAAVVAQIGAALRTRGYFYCYNVSCLPTDYVASVARYAARAHALPLDVKQRFAAKGSYSGLDVDVPEVAYEPGTTASVRAWDFSRARFARADGSFDASRYPPVPTTVPRTPCDLTL